MSTQPVECSEMRSLGQLSENKQQKCQTQPNCQKKNVFNGADKKKILLENINFFVFFVPFHTVHNLRNAFRNRFIRLFCAE